MAEEGAQAGEHENGRERKRDREREHDERVRGEERRRDGCRRIARGECERERAARGGGQRSFGAASMSVCTRTPSRSRRWRNVATHRKAPQHSVVLEPDAAGGPL